MKPNFALNLSHDGIGLFHRTKGGGNAGWTLIDEVPLDDPEFADKLKLLRKKAADLEKGGLATKLIIPNSQILYTEVEAPGPDDISREVQIRDSLEGLTPYDVGQLVFDWRKTKTKMVKVAIVARETLTEAEQFAKEHRFNPVSFVARPKGKGFRGEAFFGKSAGASALLGPGEKIEPDKSPVPEIEPKKPAPDAKADDTADKKPEKTGEKPTPPATEKADKDSKAAGDVKPADSPAKGTEGVAFTSTSEIPVSSEEEDARVAALLAEVPDPLEQNKADPGNTTLDVSESDTPETGPDTDGDKAEKPGPKANAKTGDKTEAPILAPFPPTPEEDELPVPIMPAPPPPPRRQLPPSVAASLEKPTPAKASKPVSKSLAKSPDAVKPTLPAKSVSEPAPAFSSRRVGPVNETGPTSNGPAARKPLPSPAVPPVAAKATPPLSSKPNGALTPSAPAVDSPNPKGATGQASLTHAPKVASVANPVLPSDDLPNSNGNAAGKAGIFNRSTQGLRKRAAAKTTTPAQDDAPRNSFNRLTFGPGAKPDGTTPKPVGKAVPIAPPPAGTPAAAADTGSSEVDKLTMFGARANQTREIGGKPKYLGLMLILALLLIMAVVALASVFLFRDDTASGPDQAAGNEFSAAAIPDPALSSPIAEQPLSGQSTPGPEIVASVPGQPVLPDSETLGAIDTDLLADQEPEPELPGTDAVAEVPAPPASPQQAEILSDDAAEARYAATGIWQKAPVVPSEPPGNRIDDLYVASIDPAVTGHDAIALPPANPATRDVRPSTPPPPPPPGTEFAFDDRGLVTPTPSGALSPDGHLVFSGPPPVVAPLRPATTPVPEITEPTNPLAGFRPKPRPTGLVESTERVNLGGVTRSELASIRPKARPQSFQEAAQAAVAEAAVAIAAEAAVAEAAAAANAPNELAVASSPAPGYRPGNFSRIVEAARSNASASDGSTVVSASAAATVVPSIPTRASVATQATINNAIRLNRINLIGIYGSTSSRRALVRMKNGRYVKVQVGDSLDGGKVISITANRLVYKKGGRTKTLELLPLG